MSAAARRRRAGAAVSRRIAPWQAAVLDALLIGVFAAIGRASHGEGEPVLGAAVTAWPFLVGATAGWALVRLRSGRWPLSLGPGIPVWACTVLVGMLLRALTSQGTAFSFVLVAALSLGVLLLGWRALLTGLRG